MNTPRFSFRGIGDDLLDHADSLKVEVHRIGTTLGLRFELIGCVGSLLNCDTDSPDQARQVRDFADKLLAAFGPQPVDDDDEDCEFC